MAVKVRCTSCEKVFAAPDAARGKAVKCPNCETRVAVPAEDAPERPAAKRTAEKPSKKPAKKDAKPEQDSEDFLKTLDLRKAEDADARICSKCGFDMQYQDEEDTECPKCGFDIEAGGLGAKARKKSMKGPDPADFFVKLASGSWKFVLKNQMLAWRTAAYSAIGLALAMLCALGYLYVSPLPPRGFFALCFTVSFMMIPGWLWVLDSEVIKLTLERKDKFKKLNFDFFLASSKGILFFGWLIVGAGPILAAPVGLGYYLVNYSGQPDWVMGVCIGIGMIPVLLVLPVVMSHMTMPVSYPGWMIWKVLQASSKCVGALCVWFMWLFITCIPLMIGITVIALIWGSQIVNIVRTMESNADINRKITAAESAPKQVKKGVPAPVIDMNQIGKPVDVDLIPLIGPAIILLVLCMPLGFIGMFNMRINGQFTYYFKDRLQLIDRIKEHKYVAKERRREDDEDEAPTAAKEIQEGVAFSLTFAVVGLVGGMIMGNVSQIPMVPAILLCTLFGIWLAGTISHIMILVEAFKEDVSWGLVSLFVPLGIIFYMVKFHNKLQKLIAQFVTSVISTIVCTVFITVNIAQIIPIVVPGLPPVQQMAPDQQMMMNAPAGGAQTPAAGHAQPNPQNP